MWLSVVGVLTAVIWWMGRWTVVVQSVVVLFTERLMMVLRLWTLVLVLSRVLMNLQMRSR